MRAFNHFRSGERGVLCSFNNLWVAFDTVDLSSSRMVGKKRQKNKCSLSQNKHSGQEENFSKYITQPFSNTNPTRAKGRLSDR